MSRKIYKAWFANIRQYEDLSYGSARTLGDLESAFDKLTEEKERLEQRNKEKVEVLSLINSELESLPDWGKEISTTTIEKITEQLIKAGEL